MRRPRWRCSWLRRENPLRERAMKVPEVFYARSGDVSIAYQVVGDGPVDLVFVRGLAGELLSMWEQPLLVAHVMGFASFSRVLMLDKQLLVFPLLSGLASVAQFAPK